MKLPKHFPKKPIFLILIAVLLISALGIYRFFLKPHAKILDDFPIMVINNGQTAVYQEVKVAKDRLEKQIIVSNLKQDNQKEVKIYENIPKEVAQKASEIEFSIQPRIIEDDPFVLWDVEGPEVNQPIQLTYTVKKKMEDTQCLNVKDINEMQNVYKLDPFDFNDCYKYLHIKFLNAVYQNQKRREQEEKDQVQLIQPGEKKYNEVQKKAKEIIKKKQVQPSPAKSTKKISKEEAIEAVKKQYPKPLSGEVKAKWPPAACSQNDATYFESEQKWHVICIRPRHEIGGFDSAVCEAEWFFFTVDNSGKAIEEGWYDKCKLDKDGSLSIYGKPMWGIQ